MQVAEESILSVWPRRMISPCEGAIARGKLAEKMLLESETYLIKIYFSITKEEQFNRFEAIKKNPLKKWKITPVDQNAQAL